MSYLSEIANHLLVMKVPITEKILRSIIVYFALVILLRVFGKRELAQLNPFDLVVLLTLSNSVQNAIIGDDNTLLGGLIGALSLLGVNYLIVRYAFRHRRLDQILAGDPSYLIRQGKVQHAALARELMNLPELTAAARRQGFGALSEVEECVLEPTGGMSFKGKKPMEDERRHHELLERFDKLEARLGEGRRH